MKTTVLTPEFRLSFFDLFEPKGDMEGRLGFRAEMLFPLTIKMSELADMKALHDATVKPEWKAGGLVFRSFKECFINGNGKKQEGRKGHWMLRAGSGPDFPPRLLLETKQQATKRDFYPGMYARAILSAFAWEHKNTSGIVVKRGVSFNLMTVQRTRKPLTDGSDRFTKFISDAEQDALLDAAPLAVDESEDLLA